MDKTQTRREKWRVRLDESERVELKVVIDAGRGSAERRRAQILLLADEARTDGGRIDADIAAVVDVSIATVERVRRRCVEEGLEAALERRVQANRKPRKLDGAGEAVLTMIAGSEPPEGRAGWTLTLLGERLVEMGGVDSISTETVRGTLKKNSLKPWQSHQWCIPPQKNADFVAAMEDVLDVYHRDFDDNTVLVCVDEVSKQLTTEVRTAVPMEPGQPARVDGEYERHGTANLFMVCAPLRGWRHVKVTERRTTADFAALLADLANVHFPDRKIVLVMDNRNTHKLSSLYHVYPPKATRYTHFQRSHIRVGWPRIDTACVT